MPRGLPGITAARSSSASSLAIGLIRTHSSGVRGPSRAARACLRAVGRLCAATESSRSRIRPDAPEERPLASLRSLSAGTNRRERIGSARLRSRAHERGADAARHHLAALVERLVLELDDPGIGARLALALALDDAAHAQRV